MRRVLAARHIGFRRWASLPSFVLNTPPTRVTTLENGFRVATEDGFGETATVGVWIDSGSSFENEKNNGSAHFLEHMAFKGTASRSRQQIETQVENMGAHLNAYTSREQTVYVTQSFKKDVPQMVSLLSDILQNSEIREEDIENERRIILQEKESVENRMEEVVFDHLHSCAYQGTPLALTILGETENILNLKRKDLVDYISTHYTGPRMVLVGSGAVNHDELVDLARKNFGGLSAKNNVRSTKQRVQFTGSEIRIRSDDMPEPHVAIAFESVGWSHPHFFTAQIIQALLGSWNRANGSAQTSGSRLAEIVASNNLAHSFQAFNTVYKNTGLFGIYAVGHAHGLDDLVYQCFNEFQRLGVGITEDELQRAKNKVKSSLLANLDGSMQVAEDIGRQMLTLGRRLSPAELFMRIDNITTRDVAECLDIYFNDVCPAVVGVGPIADLPDYHYMRTWTFWDRL